MEAERRRRRDATGLCTHGRSQDSVDDGEAGGCRCGAWSGGARGVDAAGVAGREMGEDSLDDLGSLDARDDPQRAATHATVFDVDVEVSLETLHPAHGRRTRPMRLADGLMGRFGDDTAAVFEVRGEHDVVSGEMGAGTWHEGDKGDGSGARTGAHAQSGAADGECGNRSVDDSQGLGRAPRGGSHAVSIVVQRDRLGHASRQRAGEPIDRGRQFGEFRVSDAMRAAVSRAPAPFEDNALQHRIEHSLATTLPCLSPGVYVICRATTYSSPNWQLQQQPVSDLDTASAVDPSGAPS